MIVILLLTLTNICAQGQYRAGDVVPKPFLKVFGTERFFKVMPVDEDLKAVMQCYSFKDERLVSWEDLRYLQVLHCDNDGNSIVGEMVCNVAISEDLLQIFMELYKSNYPIERMLLIDRYDGNDEASMCDNNTSCFNQRSITAGGRLSKHSYGLAVDINPKYNPYYKLKASGKANIKPESSADYLNRDADFPYKIMKGDLCYRLFKQHGFHWGGEWANGKDYQHFER